MLRMSGDPEYIEPPLSEIEQVRIELRRHDILHHDDKAEPGDQRLLAKQREMRDPHCDQHSDPDQPELNCHRQGLVMRIDRDVPRYFSRAGRPVLEQFSHCPRAVAG